MFWTKKEDPRPCGFHLDELMMILSVTSLKVKQKGNSLIVKHPKMETVVQVDKLHDKKTSFLSHLRGGLPMMVFDGSRLIFLSHLRGGLP